MCCIFFGPRSCIPSGYFLQMRGRIRAVGCSLSSAPHWFSQGFRLLPTGSHKADIPLCWAKRMLESEARVSGASRPAAPAALLLLSSHAALLLHFSEINKSSQSYVSLRLRREPLIKQLSCWSEVTLILGLRERKPNGAVFMLTVQSSAQLVGPAVAWARKAHSVSSREAGG